MFLEVVSDSGQNWSGWEVRDLWVVDVFVVVGGMGFGVIFVQVDMGYVEFVQWYGWFLVVIKSGFFILDGRCYG